MPELIYVCDFFLSKEWCYKDFEQWNPISVKILLCFVRTNYKKYHWMQHKKRNRIHYSLIKEIYHEIFLNFLTFNCIKSVKSNKILNFLLIYHSKLCSFMQFLFVSNLLPIQHSLPVKDRIFFKVFNRALNFSTT